MENTDELGGFQFLEVRSSLPDELLMYADKMSMAHSLEVRVPYLDKEIVEYVQRLPADFKVRNGSGKWLHRRVCDEFLCPKIMKRRKRGFAVNVVDNWFRLSLTKKMDSLLCNSHSIMFGYLNFAEVQRILREHRSGRHDYHKILFSLLIFEEWLRLDRTRN
jgi:asparagine synthase (glutamine-hydrolysing)